MKSYTLNQVLSNQFSSYVLWNTKVNTNFKQFTIISAPDTSPYLSVCRFAMQHYKKVRVVILLEMCFKKVINDQRQSWAIGNCCLDRK